jgi:Tfp pilus assembly PilM family ATPase
MKFHKIFEAFPPPQFLDIPFAGIAVSDSAIRAIKFGRNGSSLYVEKYAEKKLAVGAILSGEINNKEEVVRILQELKKEMDLRYVKVSLPEEKAYLFTAKIPIVKKSEMVSAIESKIEENVPVPPGELIFDYNLMDHRKKDHLDVVVSNLPISVVDSYVEVVSESGLSLLALEVESQAVARALLKPEEVDTVLIVHFEPEKVGLYVVSERVVHFASTILTKGESPDNQDFLSQEIKKLYVYWHTLKENVDKPERKIEEIIVCGETSGDSIVSYLAAHNGVRVKQGNVWTNVFSLNSHVPEISFNDSLKYSASVGLALPSPVLLYDNHV